MAALLLLILLFVATAAVWVATDWNSAKERGPIALAAVLLIAFVTWLELANLSVRIADYTRHQIEKQLKEAQAAEAQALRQAMRRSDRTLQDGLKRLGCYDGPLDGIWGDASAAALAKLITAVGKTDEHPDGSKVKVRRIKAMIREAEPNACRKETKDAGAQKLTPPINRKTWAERILQQSR